MIKKTKRTYAALSLVALACSTLLSTTLFGFYKGLGVMSLLVLFGWGMNLENAAKRYHD